MVVNFLRIFQLFLSFPKHNCQILEENILDLINELKVDSRKTNSQKVVVTIE